MRAAAGLLPGGLARLGARKLGRRTFNIPQRTIWMHSGAVARRTERGAIRGGAPLSSVAAAAASSADRVPDAPLFSEGGGDAAGTAGSARAEAGSAGAPLEPLTFEHPNSHGTKGVTFAVFEHGGKQFKVVEDDVLMLDYIKELDIGEEIVFDKVLLLGTAEHTVLGRPLIPSASVCAVVEEQTQTRKIRVFKKRRRKNSSKTTKGHRSDVTILRITDVETP
uniref:Large ribosomal subunit protein bL21m n=1 Tax=Lotharella oceanica TaxID=641309 RepID=A0A7S2XBN0_9EUKA|mmetsp:Transcript_21011/g.39428  ORF Transcript_21011/g.39428 Transcript_21011/m.39428 type:complete len:222 (+) Transcript_21011:31-696(+)